MPEHRPTAWVQVRDSIVQLDSVRYDPKNDMTQGVLPPWFRRVIVRDTLPSARADDSLRFLARALAERSRQVDSMRATMDSMAAMLRSERMRTQRTKVRGDSQRPGDALVRAMAEAGNRARVDSMNAALRTYFEVSGRHIDAALKRYYPNLASEATPNTVIWFLADSSGNVLRSARREGMMTVSAESAASVFGGIDPRAVGMSSIREWTVGDRHLSVAWIELKQ